MIYLIRSGDSNKYKIGYSKHDVGARLKALQTGNPEELILICAIEGSLSDELDLHIEYLKYRIRGEWFLLSRKQVVEISSKMEPVYELPLEYEQKIYGESPYIIMGVLMNLRESITQFEDSGPIPSKELLDQWRAWCHLSMTDEKFRRFLNRGGTSPDKLNIDQEDIEGLNELIRRRA